MYTLSLDLPNQAEGAEVEVDGLGLFLNGSDNEIPEADAQQFAVKHGHSLLKANFPVGISVVHGALEKEKLKKAPAKKEEGDE